jgi:hypothetical protein
MVDNNNVPLNYFEKFCLINIVKNKPSSELNNWVVGIHVHLKPL